MTKEFQSCIIYKEVSILKYLKWKDTVIAKINSDFSVNFVDENSSYFANPDSKNAHWTAERFLKFKLPGSESSSPVTLIIISYFFL